MSRQISNTMTESMKKVRGWFDDYMRKATDDKNQILENMDGLVDRIKKNEAEHVKVHLLMGKEKERSVMFATQVDNIQKCLSTMQTQINNNILEIKKLHTQGAPIATFQKTMDHITQQLEYNQNHFKLIESYVEKYVPITIQEAITNNLNSFINNE